MQIQRLRKLKAAATAVPPLLEMAGIALLVVVLLLAGCATTGQLTPEEQARCDAGGGCAVVTAQAVEEALTKAYMMGMVAGRQTCGRGAMR
jgi:hypothetical protein